MLIKVNGGWGEWCAWSECPVTCGGGHIRRNRTCDNPDPQHGGDLCTVDGSTNSENETCNETPCPSKLILLQTNIIPFQNLCS